MICKCDTLALVEHRHSYRQDDVGGRGYLHRYSKSLAVMVLGVEIRSQRTCRRISYVVPPYRSSNKLGGSTSRSSAHASARTADQQLHSARLYDLCTTDGLVSARGGATVCEGRQRVSQYCYDIAWLLLGWWWWLPLPCVQLELDPVMVVRLYLC